LLGSHVAHHGSENDASLYRKSTDFGHVSLGKWPVHHFHGDFIPSRPKSQTVSRHHRFWNCFLKGLTSKICLLMHGKCIMTADGAAICGLPSIVSVASLKKWNESRQSLLQRLPRPPSGKAVFLFPEVKTQNELSRLLKQWIPGFHRTRYEVNHLDSEAAAGLLVKPLKTESHW
jgi:hypothetical protein